MFTLFSSELAGNVKTPEELASLPANPDRINDAEHLSIGLPNQKFGTFTDAVSRLSAANRSYFESTYTDEAEEVS